MSATARHQSKVVHIQRKQQPLLGAHGVTAHKTPAQGIAECMLPGEAGRALMAAALHGVTSAHARGAGAVG